MGSFDDSGRVNQPTARTADEQEEEVVRLLILNGSTSKTSIPRAAAAGFYVFLIQRESEGNCHQRSSVEHLPSADYSVEERNGLTARTQAIEHLTVGD